MALIIGQVLNNGATLLAFRESHSKILAYNEGAVQPFVIWSIMQDGSCHSGDYYRHIEDAVATWKRIK